MGWRHDRLFETRALCGPKDLGTHPGSTAPTNNSIGSSLGSEPQAKGYLCSKSTGAVTSCTRKYFASAGYFLATASYIAYATLRYETCPAGVVRSSEM